MPKRLLIIGVLFCIAGVLAIWSIIVAFLHDSISLNFAAFLLPVGVGLLHGKPSSRRWAKFWIILGYVFCGLLVLIPPLWPENSHVDLFGHHVQGLATWPYFAIAALLLTGLFYLVQRLLYSDKVTAYLERPRTTASAPDGAAPGNPGPPVQG